MKNASPEATVLQRPKVFISYSWTNETHKTRIKEWADRLIHDGCIEVVLDIYDLKEGQDKFVFMEAMVRDPSVTHVLVFSDKRYAEKASTREGGVGTESTIISEKVYGDAKQEKFIPVVCETDANGEPYLPVFMSSRKWVNFVSPEKANQEFDRLVRLLWGKPLYEKPKLPEGLPSFLVDEELGSTFSPHSRLVVLKNAVLAGQKGTRGLIEDFFKELFAFIDIHRVRKEPELATFAKGILDDVGKLTRARDSIVDFLLFMVDHFDEQQKKELIVTLLERLLVIREKPEELSMWCNDWFKAIHIFTYETFLYLIATLIRTGSWSLLRTVYTTSFYNPNNATNTPFSRFGHFYAYCQEINPLIADKGHYLSAVAELIKRQANRTDISFKDLKQADALTLLMALIDESVYWFPQLFYYVQMGEQFPLFVKATRSEDFVKLCTVTGIHNAQELKDRVHKGAKRLDVDRWHDFRFTFDNDFSSIFNLENLHTL
jgi:hypothetical protein